MLDGSSKARIKAAMVIYELERELGRYIRERPHDLTTSPTGQDILQRSGIATPISARDQVGAIIENSYLGEALSLAGAASKGTADELHLVSLRKLVETLELFDIRNAVSHPNRQFPECYWYRCAAIASDPTIDALHFIEVSRAFQSALAGNLEEPPEDWMYRRQWIIPNGLPEEFEHSVTGLFGRAKDITRLNKELKNPRASLIAVIARGGVGKTSLVLQTLSDFCLSSESISLSDGVAFVSLKQEKLGHNGIQLLDAPATIDEVKEALLSQLNSIFDLNADGFNSCISKLSNNRIWLFVDNLETVLRDSPSSFTEFYDTLPGPWKVIVTSRIPVDGGRNIPLDPLEEPGALAFARQYFETKGHPVTDVGLIQKIVTGCQKNPLAIRLTIDSFIAGNDISSALSKTSEEVTAFSFSNLLDALPKEANDVLEGLFVLDNPTRSTLCEALQLSVDSIAAAIGSLVRTSLIVRTETGDGETYSLGASIRELLRTHPRDRKTRTQIIDWINRTRASASETLKRQTENKVSPVDISFVPSGTDHSLISTANSVHSAVLKSDLRALSQLDIKIRSLLDGNPNCSFLHRVYGRVLFELDDLQAAEKHFSQAISLDNVDPAPKLALAYLYQKMQRLAEGRALCDELICNDWGDEEKAGKDGKRVWSLYLTILNFSEELNSVFTYTQDWKAQKKAASVFGVARASAYRRQADQEFRLGKCDAQRVGKLICSALDELDAVSEIDGPSKPFQSELRKSSGELDYYINKKRLIFNQASIDRIFSFIQKHKADIRRYCETDVSLLITRSVSESSSNERTSASAAAAKNNIRISELKSDGYTIVTVKYLPKSDGFPSYVFAEDENNNTYYLHVDAFEDGNWREWVFVEKGTTLAIRHQPNNTGNARKATEIRSITS